MLPQPVILLDIEGTTTAIDFVHVTLFSYARKHLKTFLDTQSDSPPVQQAISDLRALYQTEPDAPTLPAWPEGGSPLPYILFLMDDDRKAAPLKTLQGMVWQQGYHSGELKTHLYPDVVPALQRWKEAGKRLAIYSSGSVQAQRLLFAHTENGDLTGLFDACFDTAVGGKKEAQSYARIAEELGVVTADIAFLSDNTDEITAAQNAGCPAITITRGSDSDAANFTAL